MPAWFTILLLLLIGFILLLIELFIIPGFGLVGISGLTLLFISSYLSFKTLSVLMGFILSVGSFIFVIILIKFFAPRFSKSIGLEEREERERGFSASADYSDLLGKEGESATLLRPSGIAIIDGKKFSVITEGMFVSKGAKVRVAKIEGGKIFVRQI